MYKYYFVYLYLNIIKKFEPLVYLGKKKLKKKDTKKKKNVVTTL